MSKRFGKARVPNCGCKYNFTCRPCLEASHISSEFKALLDDVEPPADLSRYGIERKVPPRRGLAGKARAIYDEHLPLPAPMQDCATCSGAGWGRRPDGSPASCEDCEGYGSVPA